MIAQLSVSYVNIDHQQKFQCLPLYNNSVLMKHPLMVYIVWHWYPMLGLVIIAWIYSSLSFYSILACTFKARYLSTSYSNISSTFSLFL